MDLGIPVQTVANTLRILVGGQIVSTFKDDSQQYDVWLRADKPFRESLSELESMSIPSGQAAWWNCRGLPN